MNDNIEKKYIYKLYLEIYPELVSSTYKSKQLSNYAIWSVLKAIDKHKKGEGKFKFNSVLFIITTTLNVSDKYAYEIFKKGVDFFWKKPNKDKDVYLISLEKVAINFPHEIAKTAPFKIRISDLWVHETPGELKTFLLGFVFGRYGQKKPISKSSLCDNLGCSKSTVKRQIKKSERLTIKNNLEYIKEFDHINFASTYLNKLKLLYPENKNLYKIIKQDNKFIIFKQLSNSYSLEDFSRLKLSKRPRALKKIDAEASIGFEKRKFYIGKNQKNNTEALAKVEDSQNFYVWKKITENSELPSSDLNPNNKTRTRLEAKFWLNKEINQEC